MDGTRQFSIRYVLLEVALISVAIVLMRSVYVTWNLMWPRPWLFTIPAATVVIQIAIFGLFNHFRFGALIGFASVVLAPLFCNLFDLDGPAALLSSSFLSGIVALCFGVFLRTLPKEGAVQVAGG